MAVYSVIIGSGKYIPDVVIKNEDFLKKSFINEKGEKIPKTNEEIIRKFQEITDIQERRYLKPEYNTSDMGYFAAKEAIETAKIDPETIDNIIFAHNFGDILHNNQKSDLVPALASRAKHMLKIQNPDCVAYDLPFGCPGWVQGIIQADYYIKSGDAKRVLVIGAENLSRIADPHDIDSMIYSDGAGAVIVEARESDKPIGIICHKTRSDTYSEAHFLKMDISYYPEYEDNTLFMKMNGRKLYEYALNTVPGLVAETIKKAGISIHDIKKVLIHQANAKMDEAIIQRVFKIFGLEAMDSKSIMPMTISKLGNNSVATVPILYDMIIRGEMPDHSIHSGDHLVFASVGAGMNVNAFVYRVP